MRLKFTLADTFALTPIARSPMDNPTQYFEYTKHCFESRCYHKVSTAVSVGAVITFTRMAESNYVFNIVPKVGSVVVVDAVPSTITVDDQVTRHCGVTR